MRNKSFVPGFLYDFPHAKRFKGGGAPTVQPPAYNPPAPVQPPSPDSAVSYEVARDYFKDNVYSGEAQAFTDPWNNSFNEWASGLESSFGVDSYTKLNYGQLTGAIKPGGGTGGTTDQPPAPPSPTAPVADSQGTLLTAPTASAPIPPVSDRSSEVQQAGREARRSAKKRRGMLSTFLAGETGGANNPAKTLLGQ